MRYSITLLEDNFRKLEEHFNSSPDEAAAYLYARIASTPNEARLLVRDVVLVTDEDIETRSPVHLSIAGRSYVRAVKQSALADAAFIFVHSHPGGPAAFSNQDDREEPDLFRLAHDRNPRACHASLVFDVPSQRFVGRVWLPDGSTHRIEVVRSIGKRWKFLRSNDSAGDADVFDRQVRAFGKDIQNQLQHFRIGVVGAGGTGSAVIEQLIRLGVGHLIVIDSDSLDRTNVNRVFGSGVADAGTPKVAIAERQAERIGLGTNVRAIPRHLSFKDVAEELRECDVVFGCTDDEWGRSILARLSVYYLIPVIDVGVVIEPVPNTELIRSIHGRVTVLQPGTACLFCRGRISPDGVRDETIRLTDPARAEGLHKEGYLTGVQEPAPSVVSFTSAVASLATTELLDRLVGFKDEDSKGTEYLLRFDADTIGHSTRASVEGCFCNDKTLWGAGDRKLFLGLTWRRI